MKLEKNQIDELNAELTLVIEKDDYLGEYDKQIRSYQQKAQLKGFRKGKTPISVIKKMYGGAVMQETVSKILTDKINDIIADKELRIIGEPYLIDRENLPELNHKAPEDYTYKFEIGMEPQFDVVGVSESDTYERPEVAISKEMVDEELHSLQKRLGDQSSSEELIQDDDVIYFISKELYNGNVLVDGHSSEFSVAMEKVNPKYQDELRKLKKGGSIDADIYELEKDLPSSQVEKYLLKVGEDQDLSSMSSDFRLEVKDVVRLTPATLDQDLFDKSFGKDEVKSEEEARAKIESYLKDYFDQESNKLANRRIMEALMEKNAMELPDGFLKKWLTQDTSKEPPTDEQFEQFKKELKWRIIKKKLNDQFEVDVTEEEIFQYFVSAVKSYSPYMDESSLKNTVFSLMQNREQVNTAVETISSGKLFEKIRAVVKINNASIDKEGFYEIAKELNQKAN